MQKIISKIFSAPSIRLKTLVILEIVMLLTLSIGGLFYFTRLALVEEAKKDAEERLEGTVQHIDNVLMSIEQSTGNFHYELLDHLDQPDLMVAHCRHMVECNPNIMGSAIAFKPNYYAGRKLFLAFVHRKKYNSPELIFSQDSGTIPYTDQNWFNETMKTGRAAWIVPDQNKNSKAESVITYCQPIRDRSGECVGVVTTGLSINLLTHLVMEAKPSPNSYSVLLSQDGTYLIHPERKRLSGQKVYDQPEIANSPSALSAVRAMLEGKTDNKAVKMNDYNWYMFYKPFKRNVIPGRSIEELNWSVATVYPEADIVGEYNHMVLYVLGIVLAGLLVFYTLTRMAIRSLLKPLTVLTESAESIAEGNFDEKIPNTNRNDEAGVFQQHFQKMQQALEADITKLEQQQATLKERRAQLQQTYQQIQEDDQVKTTFLHNVTNRMIAPSSSILESINTICDNYYDISLQEAKRETENIKQQSQAILELFNKKFNALDRKAGKEDNHE